MEKLLSALLRSADPLTGNPLVRLPGATPAEKSAEALIVIAGERGLCGNYNAMIIREAERYIRSRNGQVTQLLTVGRKACDHFRRHSSLPRHNFIKKEKKLSFAFSQPIADLALGKLKDGSISAVTIISAALAGMQAAVHTLHLLPLDVEALVAKGSGRAFDCEPAAEQIVATVIPLWFKSKIYTLLRQSETAELAERMRAMDNATRNAGTLIEELTLEVNKTRQAIITRELTEITGTVEVIKS
jgi:F-type H+-transporting ATPase subunit gamma